ncbi:MAG: MarC family protein [Pseudomonadota bacterium]
MLDEALLVSFAVTLFSMMNPVGNVALFAGLTARQSPAESRRVARSCAIASAITLLVVAWGGDAILKFFGISVDALRAAGGLIVLTIGMNMLSNRNDHKHSENEDRDAAQRQSIAIVPLAIPIVAGPGAMVAVLVSARQHTHFMGKVEISGVIIAMSVVVWLFFNSAPVINKRLGASGMGVVTRVMGMLLIAIAMGMMAQGLRGLLPGLDK